MKYNILVVDDEISFRTSLCECYPWNDAGFQLVGQCSNGLEALQFLRNNLIHVMLCDINMPVINGIKLVQMLDTMKDAPVVVFFSGYRDFEYARQAVTYGVRFYLLKPLQYEVLSEALCKIKSELDQKFNMEESSAQETDSFIANVHNYVDTHLENANLVDLSATLFMNSSYVSQLYKQKTGQNFSEYLFEVRMKKAAELLNHTGKKIYEIGQMVGYSNTRNFTRAFFNYYKETPSIFRSHHISG